MKTTSLLSLVLLLAACAADDEGDPLDPGYTCAEAAGCGEPPDGYCEGFSTYYDVYSPSQAEWDWLYCYQWSDYYADEYIRAGSGYSCGSKTHGATYSNQTIHCRTTWGRWIPY